MGTIDYPAEIRTRPKENIFKNFFFLGENL